MPNSESFLYKHRYAILFSAIGLVYFFNMFIDIMEIDAAQYALISMEMSMTKSFLHVYQQGQDYLDKPPLLFWMSSLSFILFGISNFAYKLPSVLIAVLGVYSTYRFTLLWYDKYRATLAAVILASCQALFLITNDVRTDTNLLGLVIFTVWQLSEYLRNPKWKYLILTAVGIGGAMMAKGPIGLIVPALAFGAHFLLKKEWNNIFKWQWLVMLVIVAIILLPMSYGLYTQFDLHPEKYVYGLQGPSGLRFFYWTQSFGRITGESQWDNGSGYFYFLHTILWDYQPWVLLFIPALLLRIRNVFKKEKTNENTEYITLGGFILVFAALSMSHYKLPHYIFVIFPFASVITADFLFKLKGKYLKNSTIAQFSIMHLFWLLIVVDFVFFFPPQNFMLPVILFGLFILHWAAFMKLKGELDQLVIPTLITAVSFNILMSLNFYPNLLEYQALSQAGKMVAVHNIPNDKLYHFNKSNYAFDFYSRRIVPGTNIKDISSLKDGSWVYVNEEGMEQLKRTDTSFTIVEEFPSFKVTTLKVPFLFQKTRPETLKTDYIIEIQQPE